MCFYVIVYRLRVDVRKSGTTQIQNVLDKGYNLVHYKLACCIIDAHRQTMVYEKVKPVRVYRHFLYYCCLSCN